MHGVGVAEKVVEVAKYLLVCPDEEYSYIIWLSISQGVYWQVIAVV